MGDNEIWNESKEELLNLFSNKEAIDIFSMRKIKPIGFIKHKIILESSSTTLNPSFKYSDLRDDNEYFLGHMMLSFKSPVVGGVNTISMCDFFGYAAIEKVNIKIGQSTMTFESDYFLNQILGMKNADQILQDAGHNTRLRQINVGIDQSQTIKDSELIKVLLPLPFGLNFPKNLLFLAPNDDIKVDLTMRHPSNVINSCPLYKLDTTSYSDYKLHIEVYTKKNTARTPYVPFVDLPSKTLAKNISESKDHTIMEIEGCRRFEVRQDCDLNGQLYPLLFSAWKDEDDVVNQYLKFLTKHLLVLLPESTNISDIYPSTANLIEVNNGQVIIPNPNNPHQKRIIRISILRIPPNSKLYYHTNLLTITKVRDVNKAKDDTVPIDNVWLNGFNISEKIKAIEGYYDSLSKSIITTHIDHKIESQYASLPINLFRTFGEDNRALNSPNYIIWNYFHNGPNIFKSKLLDSYILKYKSNNDNQVIINNSIADNFYLLDNTKYLYTPISINPEHNESKFNFDNLLQFNYNLSIPNKQFTIKKIELYRISKDVDYFTEVNHIENNFEALMNISYYITLFVSHSIDQVTITQGSSIQKKILTNIAKVIQ